MGFGERIIKKVKLFNSEKSEVIDVAYDGVSSNINKDTIDWGEKLPDLIKPSIKNLRLCADKSTVVNGILEDLVIKSISGWVIKGDSQEAIDFISDQDERLDYSNLMHNVVWNNCIAGYRISKVETTEKAVLKAIIRIVPIEAVEDFDISIYLEDNVEGLNVEADESEAN